MAHKERVKDVNVWWPQMTRSRGKRERACMRGIQMA